MKKITAVVAFAALAIVPGMASAQWIAAAEVFGSLSDFKQGGVKEDGDGFGLRGRVNLPSTGFFVRAEYVDESIDDGTDYTEKRISGGYAFGLTPLLDLTLELEYADFETEAGNTKFGTDGFGAFVGIETNLPIVTLYGRAGYLLLEDDNKIDNDGTEIAIGARFGLLPFLSLFGEYRSLTLDPDQGGKFEVDGFRLGVRLSI